MPVRTEIPDVNAGVDRERGQRTVWWVYDHYAIEDGWIRPVDRKGEPIHRSLGIGAAHRKYFPMMRPEVATEFAKHADAADSEILKFVQNYGLLGFNELAVDRRASSKQIGDPLSWFRSHARGVQLVLELNGSRNRRRDVKEILERRSIMNSRNQQILQFAEGGDLEPRMLRVEDYVFGNRQNTSNLACEIIADILSQNLKGVSREIVAVNNTLQTVFRAGSLIACIYWNLADEIVGRTIRRCRFCGRFFSALTLKRVYCPPPMNSSGDGPCAQNDRARRHRNAKKEKLRKRVARSIKTGPRRKI